MKKLLCIITALLLWASNATACTNFPINIGAMDTAANRIVVESLSILINERTGVTVGIHYFKKRQDLDKAVNEQRLEMTIEDTTGSMRQLNQPVTDDPDQNLETLKQLYKAKKMIWLKPFAFKTTDSSNRVTLTAPVITRKSLTQFPALPRLIRKLSKRFDDQALQQLVEKVDNGMKPQNAGKEYLRDQGLI